jgi:hypothetical protein
LRIQKITLDHYPDCDVRTSGVEVQLLRDGDLLIGRRFRTREFAEQWATEERRVLEADGWRDPQGVAP